MPGVVPPPLPVTVTDAVADIVPPNPAMLAVIVVDPADTAVTNPVALTVATAGVFEVQLTAFVTF